MSTSQNLKVNWANVPTRTITAGGVEFAYRELGANNPGTPVVFLIHLVRSAPESRAPHGFLGGYTWGHSQRVRERGYLSSRQLLPVLMGSTATVPKTVPTRLSETRRFPQPR